MTILSTIVSILLISNVALCPEHEKAKLKSGKEKSEMLVGFDPTSQSTIKFPDTIAGRHASAFVKAFNSNNPATMREFETNHRAKSALKARSIDGRLAQARKFYIDWGAIKVLNVINNGDHDITVIAEATGSGNGLEMTFNLEKESPYGILSIQIAMSSSAPPAETALDLDAVKQTVEAVAKALEENYVYPKTGNKLAAFLRDSLAKGNYDDAGNSNLLAFRLTKELRAICHDKHLAIRAGHINDQDSQEHDGDEWWGHQGQDNFGFAKVEHLPGNIGYIKLNQFYPSEEAKKTAAAAMNFVANTDAIIFDLRDNGGGSPEMIAFLSGYLFDKPVHLNSFYFRPDESTSETWSDEQVPGKRFGSEKPVFVLTSDHTFSAAEEFTYNLKHLKRATIVGEATGGGAHPVMRNKLNERFWMTVPFGRAINPITKTNWEGVGVKPHMEVPADEALVAAQKLALKDMINRGQTDRRHDLALQRALNSLSRSSTVSVAP